MATRSVGAQQEAFNFATYNAAVSSLGPVAEWSSSFGYPNDEGYSEIWRVDGSRYYVKRNSWFDSDKFQVAFID